MGNSIPAALARCDPDACEEIVAGLSYDEPYAGPGRSPDRADAMVWAMTELKPGPARGPGLRNL